MLSVDPRTSRELAATLLALRGAEKETLKRINKQTRDQVIPEWRNAVNDRSVTIQEQRILGATAKALVSGSQLKLRTGLGSKTLSGGLGAEQNRAIEFGANRNRVTTYSTHSRKGKGYKVKRHVSRQLVAARTEGPTYKAGADVVPRVLSLWVATTVRVLYDAFESGK